jgi:hypothetical protein
MTVAPVNYRVRINIIMGHIVMGHIVHWLAATPPREGGRMPKRVRKMIYLFVSGAPDFPVCLFREQQLRH